MGEATGGIEFFNLFMKYPCDRKVIENPIPHKYARLGFDGLEGIGDYTQLIQPYHFGHTTSKATCLWLEGLPKLIPTEIIPKELRTYEIHKCAPGPDREKIRSKTFPNIARAMATQWSQPAKSRIIQTELFNAA